MKGLVRLVPLVVIAALTLVAPATSAVAAVPPASTHWLHRGVQISPTGATSFASPATLASLKELKNDGANEVTFVVPFYQATLTSCGFFAGPDTPSRASLMIAINEARKLNLKVWLAPHAEAQVGGWRANINATNRACWYQAYGDWVLRYAQGSLANGLVLASEMHDMFASTKQTNASNGWRVAALVKRIRAHFHGRLSYDAQVGGQMGDLRHVSWKLFDEVRASCYFGLGDMTVTTKQDAERDIAQLTEKLVQDFGVFDRLHRRYPSKPILCGEIGYRSVKGASNAPYDSWTTGPADQGEQARDYQALFNAITAKHYLAGVSLWQWNWNASAVRPTGYSPQGKAAEVTLANAFGGQAPRITS